MPLGLNSNIASKNGKEGVLGGIICVFYIICEKQA